jgi:hypothetical protein
MYGTGWITKEVLKENIKLIDKKYFGGLFSRLRNS